MPIRTNIQVLAADEPIVINFNKRIIITSSGKFTIRNKSFVLGWKIIEKIGVAIINPRAISKITKTNVK